MKRRRYTGLRQTLRVVQCWLLGHDYDFFMRSTRKQCKRCMWSVRS